MKCLLDPEIKCSLGGNEDGSYCWACDPDARAEIKASTVNQKDKSSVANEPSNSNS